MTGRIRRTKIKPCCETSVTWTSGRLKDRSAFAPMTGQDYRAFYAFVHLVDLWLCSDGEGRRHAALAMGHALSAMQTKCRILAKLSIPNIGDWAHEEQIWASIQQEADRQFRAGLEPHFGPARLMAMAKFLKDLAFDETNAEESRALLGAARVLDSWTIGPERSKKDGDEQQEQKENDTADGG